MPRSASNPVLGTADWMLAVVPEHATRVAPPIDDTVTGPLEGMGADDEGGAVGVGVAGGAVGAGAAGGGVAGGEVGAGGAAVVLTDGAPDEPLDVDGLDDEPELPEDEPEPPDGEPELPEDDPDVEGVDGVVAPVEPEEAAVVAVAVPPPPLAEFELDVGAGNGDDGAAFDTAVLPATEPEPADGDADRLSPAASDELVASRTEVGTAVVSAIGAVVPSPTSTAGLRRVGSVIQTASADSSASGKATLLTMTAATRTTAKVPATPATPPIRRIHDGIPRRGPSPITSRSGTERRAVAAAGAVSTTTTRPAETFASASNSATSASTWPVAAEDGAPATLGRAQMDASPTG